MIERQYMVAGALLATVIFSATPASTATCPQEPRFEQPLLVPGAIWSFDVQLDLLHPANAGKTLHGSFALTGQADDRLLVTWAMGDEKQVLAADIFADKISTAGIANASSGVDLTLTPPLVHFDYPLSVGKTWAGQASFSGLLGGHPMMGTVTSVFSIVREEVVTTPAGTFETLVLVNDMTFPALGQLLQATLWVTENGILIKRESRVNGVLVQAIAISGIDVPVNSMIQQTLLELGLLRDELRRDQCDDAAVEAALRRAERKLEHSVDQPRKSDLEVARAALESAAARLRAQGVPDNAPALTGARVIANHISLGIEGLKEKTLTLGP